MPSPACEVAIAEALEYGNALLKIISANDVGLRDEESGRRQSHQAGFYLPKSAWKMYAPFGPVKGRKDKHFLKIEWQDGRITDSCVTWYGEKSRSEYRLTRFGRDFPFLVDEQVGNLLVLVPHSHDEFSAFVLDTDEDIEEVQSALGVSLLHTWAIFEKGAPRPETESECVERRFRDFASPLRTFPSVESFSQAARAALLDCIKALRRADADERLIRFVEGEYRLFQLVERQICQREIARVFRSVDDFLTTARSITNRRKSRAGRSLENHVSQILKDAGIPHSLRSRKIEGEPDIVIPSEEAYQDPSFPVEKLTVLAVKTTCRDRWRQVLHEGRRVTKKHLFTLQRGISSAQLASMRAADLELVVPRGLHTEFHERDRPSLTSVESFIAHVRPLLK